MFHLGGDIGADVNGDVVDDDDNDDDDVCADDDDVDG